MEEKHCNHEKFYLDARQRAFVCFFSSAVMQESQKRNFSPSSQDEDEDDEDDDDDAQSNQEASSRSRLVQANELNISTHVPTTRLSMNPQGS